MCLGEGDGVVRVGEEAAAAVAHPAIRGIAVAAHDGVVFHRMAQYGLQFGEPFRAIGYTVRGDKVAGHIRVAAHIIAESLFAHSDGSQAFEHQGKSAVGKEGG